MYAQVEKLKENKSKSIANSVAQKKSNGKQGVGFVDNRPVAKGVHLIQRKVNLDIASYTKNRLYYILSDNPQELISKNARPPEPIPLYSVRDDTSTGNLPVKIWKPRSKFADKKVISEEENELKEKQIKFNTLAITPLEKETNKIIEEIENQVKSREGDRGLRIGTAGINDCKGYADTLLFLIQKYKDKDSQMVGKMWLHYTNEKATFPYHAATVVAEDGEDAVTLEAHAGQELTAPVFHIRTGGKKGFEEANEKTGLYQKESQEISYRLEYIEEQLKNLEEGWTDTTKRANASNVLVSEATPKKNESGINFKNEILVGLIALMYILLNPRMQ